MGSSGGNYGSQVNTALQQANMPKSPLAQDMSQAFQNNYQNVFQSLMNGGQAGNAFPGLMSGAGTPGQVQNGGGFQFQQPNRFQGPTAAQQTPQQVQNSPENTAWNNVLGNLGINRNPVQTYRNPDGTTTASPGGQASVQQIPNSGLLQQAMGQANANQAPQSQGFTFQDLGQGISGVNPQQSNQQGFNPQSLFPQTSQSNPNQQGLNLNGLNPALMQQLSQQFSSPQVGNSNPSANLLQQIQGQGGQNNIQGLNQSIQQALSGLGNVGGAQLPQNNFTPAQLQTANPQNINPSNIGLNLSNPQDVSGGLNQSNLQLGGPQSIANGLNQSNLQLGGPQNVSAGQANLQTGLPNAQDSAYYDATSQLLGNQYNQGLKDLQSRFGAAGGTSRGTPAAFAQSQYASQALPQLQAALGNVRQQEVANQLTAQSQANNANLTARGQDLTSSQTNASNQLQGQNQANNALLNLNQQQLGNSQQNVANQLQGQNQANNAMLGLNQQQLGNSQQNVSNQLNAANQNNNALLNNQQQLLGNSQQNVQNLLQSVGLNNNSSLQANQQNLSALGMNQQAALQNQGLVNQGGIDSLNSLSSLFGQQGNLNNSFLSNLTNLANNSGQLGLGQNQLGSQNQLATNQLNSNNIQSLLQQLGVNQNNNNNSILGQNQLNSQNSQFNAGQNNQYLAQYMNMLQQSNQNQINNQFTGNQNLAQIMAQFGLSGIPGGSANVNLGAQNQTGMQQLSGLLSGLGSLF